MILILGLLLLGTGDATEIRCNMIPGTLKQVDAGAGQVYGVNANDDIYQWVNGKWNHIPGKLIHVTVGPAGVWGVDRRNRVYRSSINTWTHVQAYLKQIDAGGDKFLSGVDVDNKVYCLNKGPTLSKSRNLNFTRINDKWLLNYYSCGGYGCWGVNNYNKIFYRDGVRPDACQGQQWKPVEGSLAMVEVSTDGYVYGVSPQGYVYKREGISKANPIGTCWSKVLVSGIFQHVSYDKNSLWLIRRNGEILVCYYRDDDVL